MLRSKVCYERSKGVLLLGSSESIHVGVKICAIIGVKVRYFLPVGSKFAINSIGVKVYHVSCGQNVCYYWGQGALL